MATEVSVRLGNINYACTISNGRHEWMIDEPVENGGNDIAHDPYSALLASLGSCSAITVKMYAQRKGWQVEEIVIKLNITTQMVAGKKHTVFNRNITIKGNLDNEQLLRLQQIVAACPISKMLEGEIKIDTVLALVAGEYEKQ